MDRDQLRELTSEMDPFVGIEYRQTRLLSKVHGAIEAFDTLRDNPTERPATASSEPPATASSERPATGSRVTKGPNSGQIRS
jgi:hypothetical protein